MLKERSNMFYICEKFFKKNIVAFFILVFFGKKLLAMESTEYYFTDSALYRENAHENLGNYFFWDNFFSDKYEKQNLNNSKNHFYNDLNNKNIDNNNSDKNKYNELVQAIALGDFLSLANLVEYDKEILSTIDNYDIDNLIKSKIFDLGNLKKLLRDKLKTIENNRANKTEQIAIEANNNKTEKLSPRKLISHKHSASDNDVNAKIFGNLCFATEYNLPEKLEPLLNNNANVTSLFLTSTFKPLIIATTNNYLKIARLLLQAGADVEVENKRGQTPLFIAAILGNSSIFNLLLSYRADVNKTFTDKQQTVLIIASLMGHVKIVKSILENHPKVNIQDENGRTALMAAAFKGNITILKYLLDQPDIKLNYVDKFGKTALDCANSKEKYEAAEILKNAGAKSHLELTNKKPRRLKNNFRY